ncbi:hypothetical protein IWZ03DRAFT_415279 [Phyllosticta citriasiana]|uniref:Uncharacterized protein n=1 Tax=Phyllosticta citriasiana TaxID=595635 RepID=A0ABR1KQY0_9PEZI
MPLCYRITITLINIIFPPLAVIMLTGFGMDTMINCLLFIAAVLPSHIHGFYISCTYFARRRRVRKGRWPGGDKSFIASEDVLCGGASPEELRRLTKLLVMSNFQEKVTIAREEIKRIGVHQIMDDDLMPRAAATGWKVRKRPLINDPDTRPQQVSEWSPEFLFALQGLLRRCESVDEVKSLLRRQVHRRQSDATLKLTVRLARGLLLSDLTRVLMHLVAPTEVISTAQAGDKRKT